MSKKVKCCECASFLVWALPERVDKYNYECAKRVFKLASTTGACGYSMKTKQMAHEQYCKRFEKNKYLEQESEPFKQEILNLNLQRYWHSKRIKGTLCGLKEGRIYD